MFEWGGKGVVRKGGVMEGTQLLTPHPSSCMQTTLLPKMASPTRVSTRFWPTPVVEHERE